MRRFAGRVSDCFCFSHIANHRRRLTSLALVTRKPKRCLLALAAVAVASEEALDAVGTVFADAVAPSTTIVSPATTYQLSKLSADSYPDGGPDLHAINPCTSKSLEDIVYLHADRCRAQN